MMKKIAVVTGTRADFGLLCPLMHAINSNSKFQLQTIATAMHLSPQYGNTINHIQQEGFEVTRKVDCLLLSDTAVGVSKSIGLAIIGLSEIYDDIKPDVIVLLGDRTETLAAAIAAMTANMPIVHIHGGESTIGSYDESIRHSITKMASLHFTAAEEYSKRVIQLGEHPDTVFNVGSLGVYNINKTTFLNRLELNKKLNFELQDNSMLVLFHPETRENEDVQNQINTLFTTLDKFKDFQKIFLFANSDKNGKKINYSICNFVRKNPDDSIMFKSLETDVYLSLLKEVKVIIGNSSSGIIEAPYIGTPTVNIGERQKGRLLASSIFEADYTTDSIEKAIHKALDFNEPNFNSSYSNTDTVEQMIKILESQNNIKIKKAFHDISSDF